VGIMVTGRTILPITTALKFHSRAPRSLVKKSKRLEKIIRARDYVSGNGSEEKIDILHSLRERYKRIWNASRLFCRA